MAPVKKNKDDDGGESSKSNKGASQKEDVIIIIWIIYFNITAKIDLFSLNLSLKYLCNFT